MPRAGAARRRSAPSAPICLEPTSPPESESLDDPEPARTAAASAARQPRERSPGQNAPAALGGTALRLPQARTGPDPGSRLAARARSLLRQACTRPAGAPTHARPSHHTLP